MGLRSIFEGGLAVLCLALASMATSACFAASHIAQKSQVDLRKSPANGKTPVVVSVGLYITNLVAIDEARETFEVGGYLKGTWSDPRLALPAGETPAHGDAPRTFKVQELWTPPIQSANTISHRTISYFLEADRNGLVTYVEAFDGVLSSGFNLRKFPFDTQVLQFEYQPFVSSPSAFQFAPQSLPGTGISGDPHTELAAWRVTEVSYRADKLDSIGFVPPTRQAIFQIVVKRRSGFYIWKIFLPLLMLTLVPASVFWMDVKDIDWMLKVPMTMLLSMVAFEFSIARDLPRIGYVTFLDAVFFSSFVFCFVNIIELTLVYFLHRKEMRKTALKLHAAGRWAYPLGYAGTLCLLAIVFLA